jgi:hypothetical protein
MDWSLFVGAHDTWRSRGGSIYRFQACRQTASRICEQRNREPRACSHEKVRVSGEPQELRRPSTSRQRQYKSHLWVVPCSMIYHTIAFSFLFTNRYCFQSLVNRIAMTMYMCFEPYYRPEKCTCCLYCRWRLVAYFTGAWHEKPASKESERVIQHYKMRGRFLLDRNLESGEFGRVK